MVLIVLSAKADLSFRAVPRCHVSASAPFFWNRPVSTSRGHSPSSASAGPTWADVAHRRASAIEVAAASWKMRGNAVVTRTLICDAKSGSHSSGSCCRRGSPRPERVVSEDAERVAGREMAVDVERVGDGGMNGQEPLG
jgi:hypothetical protein